MKEVTPYYLEAFLSKNWFQITLLALFGIYVLQDGFQNPIDDQRAVKVMESAVSDSPKFEEMSFDFISTYFKQKKSTLPSENTKSISAIPKKYDNRTDAFIDRFAEIAIQEEAKYGIPASITLANGILLSDLGQSTLASEAQNFFMVPCTRSWDGDSMEIGDGCFRWYGSPWESFRDHSLFINAELSDRENRSNLSLAEWALEIEKIGWTNIKAKDILKAIRAYELLKFDA